MSDYDSTNDDFDDYEIEDETLEITSDEGLPSKKISDKEDKILTGEAVYQSLYHQTYESTHLMTKYEKARIIGVRAEMIAQGAPTLVDPGDLIHPVDIARKEFENNKIPLIFQRPIPSKNLKKPKYEYRKFQDLQKK